MRLASAFASFAVTRQASDEKFTFVSCASVRIVASRPASADTDAFDFCAKSGNAQIHSTMRTDRTIFDIAAPSVCELYVSRNRSRKTFGNGAVKVIRSPVTGWSKPRNLAWSPSRPRGLDVLP